MAGITHGLTKAGGKLFNKVFRRGARAVAGQVDDVAEDVARKTRIHGNSLKSMKPTMVYGIQERSTLRTLKIGQTARLLETRTTENLRMMGLKRSNIIVKTFNKGQAFPGKAAAKAYETRALKTYEKTFGFLPPFNKNYH